MENISFNIPVNPKKTHEHPQVQRKPQTFRPAVIGRKMLNLTDATKK
ncbi:MAG: hypothetical protein GQ574_01705 [Crocinitomix sp.]|nr:hypothetical protein [Crocinitomix sp.]